MRKALVVGINHYAKVKTLYGCVNDARAVSSTLANDFDTTINFGVRLETASKESEAISRGQLRDWVEDLFSDKQEIALLYFSGHGYVESTGGYLCTSECERGDDGLSLGEVLQFAHRSKAENKIIVLDSCHSGVAGEHALNQQYSELSEGMTILTASTKEQYATEVNGRGIFTGLFVNALDGAAGNLVGEVTPGSVYAHIDQSLGSWQQRPVFKTNVRTFVSLRRVKPPIPLVDLKQIAKLFPAPDYVFRLNPTFEKELRGRTAGMPAPDAHNTEVFAILQKYNRVGLVVPVNADHMWHAAMESTACKLTPLGEHYRRLVSEQHI